MKLDRPVKFPIGSDYGVAGKHWLWHLEEGKWVRGQKDGIGNHRGVDFLTPVGSEVRAVWDGFIMKEGFENFDNHEVGFGLRIIQQMGYNGNIYLVYYGHLSKTFEGINKRVKAGDVIALSGNTGRSSGPHLHVEVRDLNQISQPIKFT